jgi:hypothetical protein
MAESHCPICHTKLEGRDVAPCFDCGDDPRELDDLANGKHTYSEVLAFGVPLVVCNVCEADFASYDQAYFNRPREARQGLGEFVFVRQLLHPVPAKDKYCPACSRRLAFLRFLAAVRATGSPGGDGVE